MICSWESLFSHNTVLSPDQRFFIIQYAYASAPGPFQAGCKLNQEFSI